MEIWKDIIGYEGLYQVSNLGNVKSLKKKSINRHGWIRILPELIMIQKISNNGYKRVGLVKNGHQKQISVHRLVTIAFIENKNNKPCVNHKDGNKLNNNVDNLEWVTISENSLHSTRVLCKLHNTKGDKDSQSKCVYQISAIDGKVIMKFGSVREAERETGIDRAFIGKCANGIYAKAKGYVWSFDQSEPIVDYSLIKSMAQ